MKIKQALKKLQKGNYCKMVSPLCEITPVLSILEKELENLVN